MEEITYKQYWNEVKDIANMTLEEYEGEEAQNDGAFETVDGHQWVIYSAYHFDVLKHSSDENAFFEMYGERPDGDSVSEILQKFAFAALLNDVQIALQELREKQAEVEA